MRTSLLLASVLLALLVAGCGGDAPSTDKVLRFTAIPDTNTTLLKEKYAPVADYLSEKLGVPVEYVPSTDYSASVEMFRNGDVYLAWFGGLTGVQAREEVEGAHAIAQGVEDPKFHSFIIAHKDTGLEKSDEFPQGIADLSFTFGSESSTSGRLMPEFFLRENTGKSPEDFFSKDFGFSGSHDKTVALVESGQVQAGAVNYKVYNKRVESGKTDPDVCRAIWRTPDYADYNFTAHPALETDFRAGMTKELQQALIDMKDEKLLGAFSRSGMIKAEDADFAAIRDVAIQLGMIEDK